MPHELNMYCPPLERTMKKREIYEKFLSAYSGGWEILSKATVLAEEGEQGSIVAEVVWDEKHPMYPGHFEGNEIFPGTFESEAAGQAAGLHAILRNGKEETANEVTPVVQEAHAKFYLPCPKGLYKIHAQPNRPSSQEDEDFDPNKKSSQVFYYGATIKDNKEEVVATVECEFVLMKRRVLKWIIRRRKNTSAESPQ